MEYANKLALPAFSFACGEGGMLCLAVLSGGGKAENSLIHTFRRSAVRC